MALVLTTVASGQVIDPTVYNANNATIAALLNGGLTKDNLSASAGILASQQAGAYEHLDLPIICSLSTGWPATTQVARVPFSGTTGDTGGDWTVTEVDWHTNNAGAAGTGTWQLLYGGYTGNPAAWTTVATVTSGTLSKGTGASAFNSVAVTGLSVALTRQAYPCQLVLYANAADATALNAAGNFLIMSVRLRRTIAAV